MSEAIKAALHGEGVDESYSEIVEEMVASGMTATRCAEIVRDILDHSARKKPARFNRCRSKPRK